MAAPAYVGAYSQWGSSGINNVSINVQSVGQALGDQVFAVILSSASTTVTPPAGWSRVAGPTSVTIDLGSKIMQFDMFTKVTAAGELSGASPLVFTRTNSVTYVGSVFYYRGVDASAGFTTAMATSPSGGSSSLTQATFSITTTRRNAAVLHVATGYTTPNSGRTAITKSPSDTLRFSYMPNSVGEYAVNVADITQVATGATASENVSVSSVTNLWEVLTIALYGPNTPPTAPTVTAPNGGEVINTGTNITWTAGTDPDGDPLTYDIDYSANNGGAWTNIATGVSGLTYAWNTTALASSAAYLVRVRSRDSAGATSAYDQSNAVFTIQHNQAPNPATWASPANGTTLDRASAQTLTFNFLDPDPGDVLTSFDYRYRIVGAPTWITGSQSGSTPSLTFAANALAAGTYEVQVLTYDGQGVAATGWSASLQIVMASAPAAPAITTPASGGTVATTTGVAAWTVGTQTGYQVQQIADNAGVMADPNVPANVYSDTGQVTGASAAAARNAPQTYPVNNRYEWVRVRIQNNTLWSAWTAVRYQVTYTPPAAVGVAVSAPPTVVDSLQVAVTLPAPSGSQPVVTSIELWRQRISNQAGAVIANETPVRVATTPPTAGGTTVIQDLTVASGNGYQYQAIAIGANNTVTRSPWVS